MDNVLFSWIGLTDLKASRNEKNAGIGPIAQAIKGSKFDSIILLTDHSAKENKDFLKWLSKFTKSKVKLLKVNISSPTNFGDIYENAVKGVKGYLKNNGKNSKLTFHISPGTPAMAAVWIILSKTLFPAKLVQSSLEKGLQTVSFPFDISADYIPDLLRKPDEDLLRLSQGLPPEAPEFQDIVHRCIPMKRLITKARRVAPRQIPVLILGESGTGKELLARAIHKSSAVKDGPFVAVNCGAIPGELVESELFGHEKGAFTGADKSKSGYIEGASEGTLFLDEVGELPQYIQVKLLRVLQENQITRVGSTQPKNVKFRLISATNRNLTEDVAENRFRDDLFHRIAVAILQIPPLREREGDLGLLIDTLLKKINQEARDQPGYQHKNISASAKNLMYQHPWLGNIRELINTLQRAAVWSYGPTIDLKDIKESLLTIPRKKTDGILERPLGNGLILQDILKTVAQNYLTRAMKETGENKTKAASLLGLPNYQTLTNWMKKYELE